MTTTYLTGAVSANALADTILRWVTPAAEDPMDFLAERKLELAAFLRVRKYRILTSEAFHTRLVQLAVALSGGGLLGIVRQNSEYALYIGGHKQSDLEAAVSALPNVTAGSVNSTESLFGCFPYGGVVCGIPTESAPNWDAFFRNMPEQCAVMLLLQNAPQTLRSDIMTLTACLSPYQKRQIPSGFNGQKIRDVEDPKISEALRQLGQLAERLSKEEARAISICICYAGATPEAAAQCGKQLAECLRAVNQTLHESTWCYDGFYIPSGSGSTRLAIPAAAAFCNPFVMIRTAAELSTLLPLPQEELPGCAVQKALRDGTEQHLFDLTPHACSPENSVRLGIICDSKTVEYVPLADFNRHCLVAGSTGAGKTTLLKNLIVQFHQKQIPMLIIEPVKEEFNELPEYGVPTVVYSTGFSGKPLCFNPMIPERFTSILSHIKSLVTALTIFDDQAPIPQAIELCLSALYQKHGWSHDDIVVSFTAKSFPTLPELLDFVLPYLQNECPLYRGDARVNVSSAVFTRLNQLASYRFLRGTEKLPTNSLLNGTVRIQFHGLQEASDKCFFGLFLLNAINTVLRNDPPPKQLSRIIIIDEAHNLLIKGKEGSLQSATARVADSLLTEIRTYGTGIIIADQRPAALTEHAIANTAVKIVFTLSQADDLNAVTSHLLLSDEQKRFVFSQPAGHAIVSVSQKFQIVQIHADEPKRLRRADLSMCRFCPYAHICTRESVEQMAAQLPLDAFAQQLIGALDDNRLPQAIRKILDGVSRKTLTPVERSCLFGHIAERLPSQQMRNYICSEYVNV